MNPKQRQSAQWQALRGCGHAERALQASWWQEHGAAHAGGPRAQQAAKLETPVLFAGSQGGTVARAGGNACGPLSARLDLKAPAAPRENWRGSTDSGVTTGIEVGGIRHIRLSLREGWSKRRYGKNECGQ